MEKDQLAGKFFHSFPDNEPEYYLRLKWQGQIIAPVCNGSFYIVQLFSWDFGRETHKKLVSVLEMTDWNLYDTAEQMKDEYDYWQPVRKARWEEKFREEKENGQRTDSENRG